MKDKIRLHNFKCYQSKEFILPNLTVFCGNNSVGKSTAIQALTLLLQAQFSEKVPFNGELISLGYYDDVHNCHVLNDDSIEIEIEIEGSKVKWHCPEHCEDDNDFLMRSFDDGIALSHLENKLKSFQYLQAERLGPRDNYSNQSSLYHKYWLGSQGENTADVLSQIDGIRRFEYINDEGQRAINRHDCRIHKKANGYHIFSSVTAWMQEISPGFTFQSKKERMSNVSYNLFQQNGIQSFRPKNMGFGLSYSLSVVTALLNAPVGGIVIIENPEAHLHPRGQSYLGRLIALTAQAGVKVIIETHSDHLINGMRLMVRSSKVDSNKITFYYISANIEEQVTRIDLNDQGQMTEWPEGFFDQQVVDMDMLITGNIENGM